MDAKVYRLDLYRSGRPLDASVYWGRVYESRQDAVEEASALGHNQEGESGEASYTVIEADAEDVAVALLAGKCLLRGTHPLVVQAAKWLANSDDFKD
jgi:hypothetical protein